MAEGQDPENRPDRDYDSYPSTNHPEDLPSYGGRDSAWGAGGAPRNEKNEYSPHGAGDPIHKIDVMEGFRWGFGAVFRSWQLWIGLGILFYLLMAAATLLTGGFDSLNLLQWIITAIFFFVAPLVYHAALRNVDRGKAEWQDLTDGVNYGPILGMSLLQGIIQSLIGAVIVAPAIVAWAWGVQDATHFDDPAFLLTPALLFVVGMLVIVLVQPFFTFWTWPLVDRRASFGAAIRLGLRIGAANWGRLTLFILCFGLATMVVGTLTVGIALVIIMPMQELIFAHFYRQAMDGMDEEIR